MSENNFRIHVITATEAKYHILTLGSKCGLPKSADVEIQIGFDSYLKHTHSSIAGRIDGMKEIYTKYGIKEGDSIGFNISVGSTYSVELVTQGMGSRMTSGGHPHANRNVDDDRGNTTKPVILEDGSGKFNWLTLTHLIGTVDKENLGIPDPESWPTDENAGPANGIYTAGFSCCAHGNFIFIGTDKGKGNSAYFVLNRVTGQIGELDFSAITIDQNDIKSMLKQRPLGIWVMDDDQHWLRIATNKAIYNVWWPNDGSDEGRVSMFDEVIKPEITSFAISGDTLKDYYTVKDVRGIYLHGDTDSLYKKTRLTSSRAIAFVRHVKGRDLIYLTNGGNGLDRSFISEFYDTGSGKFMTLHGYNTTRYAYNDCLNYADPYGHSLVPDSYNKHEFCYGASDGKVYDLFYAGYACEAESFRMIDDHTSFLDEESNNDRLCFAICDFRANVKYHVVIKQ